MIISFKGTTDIYFWDYVAGMGDISTIKGNFNKKFEETMSFIKNETSEKK